MARGYTEYDQRGQAPGPSRELLQPVAPIGVPNAPQLANPVSTVVPTVAQVGGVSPGAPGTGVGGAAAAAAAGFAGELQDVANKLYTAEQNTLATQAMTGFLKTRDDLKFKYERDPDFTTAPARFNDEIEKARREALGTIGDEQIRGRAELEMVRSSISAQTSVREAQWARQADVNVTALDTLKTQKLTDAVNARSAEERLAAQTFYAGEVKRNADAGWIDQRAALKRIEGFNGELDAADVTKLVSTDPKRALVLLADANNFPMLDPVRRANFIVAANERRDGIQQSELTQTAHFKPVAAQMAVGRVATPDQAQAVFDTGIRPTENATGDNSLISPAGAIGVSQILPSTARDVAKALGLRDVAQLDDEALKKRLVDDAALNLKLGRAYFQQLAVRYDGNVALAAAAYNGGMANADRWKAAAEEKFGPAFSPAQLASVVDFAETRGYLAKVYQNAGAPMDVAFSSPASAQRAVVSIGAAVEAERTRENALIKQIASANRSNDDVISILQDGYDVAGDRIARFRSVQQAAADRGDATAQKALDDLAVAERLAPHIRRAWAMSPLELDAGVNSLEVALSNSPNVTGEQRDSLKAMKAVRDEIFKLKNEDPIALGERAGVFRPMPVNVAAAPEDEAFRAQIAERGTQAVVSQQLYRGAAAALKPEEAKVLKQRFTDAGPDERFRLVRAFAENLPERAYQDTLKQFAGSDDALLFAGRLARTRPDVAKEVFTGIALQGQEGVGTKAADVKAALAAKLGGALYPDPAMQSQVVDAALALYTARRAGAGQLYDSSDAGAIEKALEDVTGPIIKRGGARVAAPPGLNGAQFDQALDRASSDSFAAFGGAYDRNGKPYTPDFLRRNATFTQVSPGASRYAVMINNAPVLTASDQAGPGGPLIVDAAAVPRAPERPLTAYQQARQNLRDASARRTQETMREVFGP